MPEYRITEKAGPYIAGQKHRGHGTKMFLTKQEAAHDLRVGALAEVLAEIKPEAKGVIKKGGASA